MEKGHVEEQPLEAKGLNPMIIKTWTPPTSSELRWGTQLSEEIMAPANIFIAAWWDPEPRTQLIHAWTPDPRNCEITNVVLSC